jgi:hypothetical protein
MTNNLTSVTIPNSITKMERKAFMDNYITELRLSNNLKEIPQEAF